MRTVPPFRFPDGDSIKAAPWLIEHGGALRPLPQMLAGWDYQTTLMLRREVLLDVDVIRTTPGLANATIRLGTIWMVVETCLRGRASSIEVPTRGEAQLTLRLELPGHLLGATLLLQTHLFLGIDRRDGQPFEPSRAGSSLWSDGVRCRLQGGAPMFPLAVVDFGSAGLDPRSPWSVQIRPDLHSPAMGAIQLLVNEARPKLTAALACAADPDPESHAILSTLYYDVGRTLIEFGLSADALDESFDEGSLGLAILNLIQSCFGHTELETLAQLRDSDPSRWALELSAGLGLLVGTP